MTDRPAPEVGVLRLGLSPLAPCTFLVTPARSLQAALLRRLELVDPDLSQALHDAPQAASSVERPWTVSTLLGRFQPSGGGQIALPGRTYEVRVTALAAPVAAALAEAFDPGNALGREPLELEHVPFAVVLSATAWEGLTNYAGLLTRARPLRFMALEFRSPTGFRSGTDGLVPTPSRCIASYLRRWNAFAPVSMPEAQVLDYVAQHVQVESEELEQQWVPFGDYGEWGHKGRVAWTVTDRPSALLRYVNALLEFAKYCGTGKKTAMGMGQTVRMQPPPRMHLSSGNVTKPYPSRRPALRG